MPQDDRKSALHVELERILDILKKDFEPERVILFGSLLSNQTTPESDIDLLIIKQTNESFFERVSHLEHLIQRKRAADLIILTPGEVEMMVKSENPYLLDILKNGRVLYEAAA